MTSKLSEFVEWLENEKGFKFPPTPYDTRCLWRDDVLLKARSLLAAEKEKRPCKVMPTEDGLVEELRKYINEDIHTHEDYYSKDQYCQCQEDEHKKIEEILSRHASKKPVEVEPLEKPIDQDLNFKAMGKPKITIAEVRTRANSPAPDKALPDSGGKGIK